MPLSLYLQRYHQDNVNVQEYPAYNTSTQKVLEITVRISANGENELHENSRSANLRLENICQLYLRFPQEINTRIPRRFHMIFDVCAVNNLPQVPV